jgi:hypothetical protein
MEALAGIRKLKASPMTDAYDFRDDNILLINKFIA